MVILYVVCLKYTWSRHPCTGFTNKRDASIKLCEIPAQIKITVPFLRRLCMMHLHPYTNANNNPQAIKQRGSYFYPTGGTSYTYADM